MKVSVLVLVLVKLLKNKLRRVLFFLEEEDLQVVLRLLVSCYWQFVE